jgi:type I restriction enzyme R subunit
LTNFDFLKSDAKFSSFADTAIAAELIFHIDIASSVVNCCRAMEFTVKWMYTVDDGLKMPYQDQLGTLISTDEFKDIVGKDIYKRLVILRQLGNIANHTPNKITRDQTRLALKNLYAFMDFIVYCYGNNYIQTSFDEALLNNQINEKEIPKQSEDSEEIFEKLKTENQALKEELTKLRNLKTKTYVSSSLDMTEAETRRVYIDVMLNAAGWEKNKNWFGLPPVSRTAS